MHVPTIFGLLGRDHGSPAAPSFHRGHPAGAAPATARHPDGRSSPGVPGDSSRCSRDRPRDSRRPATADSDGPRSHRDPLCRSSRRARRVWTDSHLGRRDLLAQPPPILAAIVRVRGRGPAPIVNPNRHCPAEVQRHHERRLAASCFVSVSFVMATAPLMGCGDRAASPCAARAQPTYGLDAGEHRDTLSVAGTVGRIGAACSAR